VNALDFSNPTTLNVWSMSFPICFSASRSFLMNELSDTFLPGAISKTKSASHLDVSNPPLFPTPVYWTSALHSSDVTATIFCAS